MKMKHIYTLALALIFAAGCAHKPVGMTNIPGVNPLTPPEPPPSGTLNGETPPQPNPTDFYEGMAMDRAALAADTIHFAYDSAVIRKSERANLDAVAQALKSDSSTKLLIEGNCDERGTEEYNRALGERRADAARNALVKAGISADRIMTKTFGKDNPVDPGHDESAWQKNRRDDFVLLHPAAGGGMSGMGGS